MENRHPHEANRTVGTTGNVVIVVQLQVADTEIPIVVAGLARRVGGSSQTPLIFPFEIDALRLTPPLGQLVCRFFCGLDLGLSRLDVQCARGCKTGCRLIVRCVSSPARSRGVVRRSTGRSRLPFNEVRSLVEETDLVFELQARLRAGNHVVILLQANAADGLDLVIHRPVSQAISSQHRAYLA